MIIQTADNKDINELTNLETAIFDKLNFPLSKASFRYHIKRNLILKCVDDNKILGYILVLTSFKIPRIYSLGVSEQARGKGVGAALLGDICSKFKNLRLEVRKDNTGAIKLYEKFGFKTKKLILAYYDDGMDAIEMVKV
ncbi:GNAT family N-acetyltransferase [Campylobacter fetus]|uniref:GNAT family N-acetyltransferase n=1 Tax=Campylobacter fetus TaxID=196 RepID=UPI0013D30A73|nr:N-acetyltransferase [Campylobacter fetus]